MQLQSSQFQAPLNPKRQEKLATAFAEKQQAKADPLQVRKPKQTLVYDGSGATDHIYVEQGGAFPGPLVCRCKLQCFT